MNNNLIKDLKSSSTSRLKKCGTITCIHNIDGCCNMENCDIYERTLQQEY